MDKRISKNISWKNLKSGVVLLNIKDGTYYTLNSTASEVWNAITIGQGKKDIVSTLTDKYDISKDQARTDIEEMFAFLLEEGLLSTPDTESVKR